MAAQCVTSRMQDAPGAVALPEGFEGGPPRWAESGEPDWRRAGL